jgi:hypothetical protein
VKEALRFIVFCIPLLRINSCVYFRAISISISHPTNQPTSRYQHNTTQYTPKVSSQPSSKSSYVLPSKPNLPTCVCTPKNLSPHLPILISSTQSASLSRKMMMSCPSSSVMMVFSSSYKKFSPSVSCVKMCRVMLPRRAILDDPRRILFPRSTPGSD